MDMWFWDSIYLTWWLLISTILIFIERFQNLTHSFRHFQFFLLSIKLIILWLCFFIKTLKTCWNFGYIFIPFKIKEIYYTRKSNSVLNKLVMTKSNIDLILFIKGIIQFIQIFCGKHLHQIFEIEFNNINF